jgi:transcriptional regulator with XRE-family HTH domain
MDNHIREEKVMTDKRETQYKQLGLNIAYYRRLKGLTQSDLAEAVNLSRNHISNMEAPGMKTSISIEKLLDIADVLEVPVKKFFDFRD